MTIAVQRSLRPQPGPPRSYRFPTFQCHALANGIRVIVAPVPTLPIVTVHALFDAGAVCDPGGKEGLAQLTAKSLLEGTGRSTGAELALRFERLGASADAHADWDAASVTVTAMAKQLDATLGLLSEVFLDPGFHERELDRLKGERLAELLQLRAEPRGRADEEFARVVYDGASRFALPDGGTETTVGSIERADLLRFFSARYSPPSATIIIVGDVEE